MKIFVNNLSIWRIALGSLIVALGTVSFLNPATAYTCAEIKTSYCINPAQVVIDLWMAQTCGIEANIKKCEVQTSGEEDKEAAITKALEARKKMIAAKSWAPTGMNTKDFCFWYKRYWNRYDAGRIHLGCPRRIGPWIHNIKDNDHVCGNYISDNNKSAKEDVNLWLKQKYNEWATCWENYLIKNGLTYKEHIQPRL